MPHRFEIPGDVPEQTPESVKQTPPLPPTISETTPDGVQHIAAPIPSDYVGRANPFLPINSLDEREKIPSQGLPYPPGYRLSYRAYTLGEIDQFENSQLSTRQQFELILRGVECSFSPHELTMSDGMYIGLLRRLASIGTNEIAVTSTCPGCGNPNVSHVNTSDLVFDDLTIPALPVKVTLSDGKEYRFSPATMSDYFKLLDTGNKNNSLALLSVQCRTLQFPESIEFFDKVSNPEDILILREIDRLLYHSVQPLQIDCKHNLHIEGEVVPCGTRYRLRIENAAEAFILPFRREGSDPTTKIQFGD